MLECLNESPVFKRTFLKYWNMSSWSREWSLLLNKSCCNLILFLHYSQDAAKRSLFCLWLHWLCKIQSWLHVRNRNIMLCHFILISLMLVTWVVMSIVSSINCALRWIRFAVWSLENLPFCQLMQPFLLLAKAASFRSSAVDPVPPACAFPSELLHEPQVQFSQLLPLHKQMLWCCCFFCCHSFVC